jgi:hypothetical protein
MKTFFLLTFFPCRKSTGYEMHRFTFLRFFDMKSSGWFVCDYRAFLLSQYSLHSQLYFGPRIYGAMCRGQQLRLLSTGLNAHSYLSPAKQKINMGTLQHLNHALRARLLPLTVSSRERAPAYSCRKILALEIVPLHTCHFPVWWSGCVCGPNSITG